MPPERIHWYSLVTCLQGTREHWQLKICYKIHFIGIKAELLTPTLNRFVDDTLNPVHVGIKKQWHTYYQRRYRLEQIIFYNFTNLTHSDGTHYQSFYKPTTSREATAFKNLTWRRQLVWDTLDISFDKYKYCVIIFFSFTNVDLIRQNRLTYLHKPAKTSTATRPNQASEARPKTDLTTNIPINTTITDTTITDHC